MNNKNNICFIANGNRYIIECATVIVSILMNSEENENFVFHIISEDITENDKNKFIQLKEIKDFEIYFYKPNTEKYKRWVEESKGKILKGWSHHVFLKLEIINILKYLDKVLFLDTDTLVLKSLKDIFNTNIDNYYVIAAELKVDIINYIREDGLKKLGIKNISKAQHIQNQYKLIKSEMEKISIFDKSPEQWINSGFMYMNLSSLREIMTEKLIDNYFIQLINSDIDIFGDEAFFNYFIPNNKILRVSSSYNAVMAIWRKEEYCDVHVAHFLGGTLLASTDIWSKVMPEEKNSILLSAWKYLMHTPWFKENPFYFLDLFSKYNTNRLEYKINKLTDIFLWMIPIKKIRDKIRKIIDDASI